MDRKMDKEMDMYDETLDSWDLASHVDALPRELQPSDLLEERTARALRDSGVIGRRRMLTRGWMAGGAAAAIALFTSGLALGQWMAQRTAANVMVAQQNANMQQTAALVEKAGAQYIQAMASLAESQQSRTSADALYARETALTVLHQAANQMVRIAPNDPVAVNILQGLDQANTRPPEQRRKGRRVIWF